MAYVQLSFLKGWVGPRGLKALSGACIAALNYNVLHHMCSTLGAPSWRTRIERTSHELHSQDSQNPCSHLLCLGIASLVTAGVGIATGGLDSTYGSYATLAAVVLIAKGLVDLAAGVAGIKGANKPSQVDGAFKLGIVAAVATLAQAVLTLPAFGGDAINFGAFVIVVYDLFFVQQAHAVKAENKDRL